MFGFSKKQLLILAVLVVVGIKWGQKNPAALKFIPG